MSSLEKLKQVTSLEDFASLLGYKTKSLAYILYQIPLHQKYKEFAIPKKNGNTRTINAPEKHLKLLQRRLANLLNECFEEICISSKHKSSLSHGFRKNHSIRTNAYKHITKRHVFNIDLKDFFPSINFGRVYGFFIKNNHFKLEKKAATIIAQIACHNNELPQGSPCSPVISNFIGHLLDIRMVNLAKKTKCTYSRYADDLTFSTNNKSFPSEIAINDKNNKWQAGIILKKEIEKVGFKINEKKTSMQYKTSRQITTGLVVNQKVNTKREYYKIARAMCHELFTTDKFYIIDSHTNNSKEKASCGTLNQLEGILSFIYKIKRPFEENHKTGTRKNNPTAITKIYREFLFYKHFFSIDKPLILYEGKTDAIYLKCALKSLAAEYSEFIEIKESKTFYKIGFLNFSSNLKDVFAVSEGSSGLASIMDIYEKHMKPFKGNGKKHPVIILIDNDSGSKEIKHRINKKLNSENDFLKTYYSFTENLYIIHLPEVNGKKDIAIEDLFEDNVLQEKINGKSFNRKGNTNPKTEYGKTVFAEKVVKANQDNINFDNFKEVFDRLKAVIEDYSCKQK